MGFWAAKRVGDDDEDEDDDDQDDEVACGLG